MYFFFGKTPFLTNTTFFFFYEKVGSSQIPIELLICLLVGPYVV